MGAPVPEPRGLTIAIGKVTRNGRTVSWPQALIRRAADAMREARTNDLLVLAAQGLNAATRTEADVALLIARPKASEAAVFAAAQSFPAINLPVGTRTR